MAKHYRTAAWDELMKPRSGGADKLAPLQEQDRASGDARTMRTQGGPGRRGGKPDAWPNLNHANLKQDHPGSWWMCASGSFR